MCVGNEGNTEMTKATALITYAAAYKAYCLAKNRTFNIDVATQYATMDLINQTKHTSEEDAILWILDEVDLLKRDAAA
jgi:hypothetical protein